MAYDKSTGILTIDTANETFDVMLDNIASALNDYRVTEVTGLYARDLGMLCTSPNTNRDSLRRPIAASLEDVSKKSESYFQENMYGFKDLVANSKKRGIQGSNAMRDWFLNTIASKGYKYDLWGDSMPNEGNYYCINHFNGYRPKTENRKLIADSIKPLKEIAYPNHGHYVSVTLPYGKEQSINTSSIPNDEFYNSGPTICKYVIEFTYDSDVPNIRLNISGYVQIKDIPEGYSNLEVTQYGQFNIDTNGHTEGTVWNDDRGNQIHWVEEGNLILTMFVQWSSLRPSYAFSTIYDSFYGINQYSTYEDGTGMSVGMKITSNLSSYTNAVSNTDSNKIGLYFTGVSRYFNIIGGDVKMDGMAKAPLEFIMTAISASGDEYSVSSDLLALLQIKVTQNYIYKIVNPYYTASVEGSDLTIPWNGIVLYDRIGIEETYREQIQYVNCLLFYGRADGICPSGYTDIDAADKFDLLPERYGYVQAMVEG